MKQKLLFVITQFYKGGAEVALLNLFQTLSPEEYEIDFLIFDQMILPSATSLLPLVPDWIHVCNAAEHEKKLAVIKKVFYKIWRRCTKHQLYRRSAFRFVRNKQYDFAFSYGEWMSPEFVAKKVSSTKKAVWIHTDIDKADYVDESILLGYDPFYSTYIFVSECSKQSAEAKFPLLKGKSVVIHNMCNDKRIQHLSTESMTEVPNKKHPLLLSVANVRTEKNHLRQVEVMKLLKERGVHITWWNIGSTANFFLSNKITSLVRQYGLIDHFLLLGAKENPYSYMRMADAITVFSDFESWSLVITEAKILGVPVIATKTSGAKEQIQDGDTGILTEFTVKDIADKIQHFLENPSLQTKIRNHLNGFTSSGQTMKEWNLLLRGSDIENDHICI